MTWPRLLCSMLFSMMFVISVTARAETSPLESFLNRVQGSWTGIHLAPGESHYRGLQQLTEDEPPLAKGDWQYFGESVMKDSDGQMLSAVVMSDYRVIQGQLYTLDEGSIYEKVEILELDRNHMTFHIGPKEMPSQTWTLSDDNHFQDGDTAFERQ